MNQYIFFIGNARALSVAEVTTVLSHRNIVFDILSITSETLIIKTEIDASSLIKLQSHLGGTIRIAQIISSCKHRDLTAKLTSLLKGEPKVRFGISSWVHSSGRQVNALGSEVKRALLPDTVARHVPCGEDATLNAVSVLKNKLASAHWELTLTYGKEREDIVIARTISIQNIHEYSLRDYRKPGRDSRRGMLPPKLAQIMINLAATPPSHIHDPFCGSGTVLGEALIAGIPTSGSDIDSTALPLAEENLRFIANKLHLPESKVELKTLNALDLNPAKLPPHTWIVSEVDLGTPKSSVSREKIAREFGELTTTYRHFLARIAQNMGNLDGLVVALPFFQDQKDRYLLPIIDDIKKMGYTILSPLRFVPNELLAGFGDYEANRMTALYIRESQHTGREIIILTKNT